MCLSRQPQAKRELAVRGQDVVHGRHIVKDLADILVVRA